MSELVVPTMAELMAKREKAEVLFGLVVQEVLMTEQRKLQKHLSNF